MIAIQTACLNRFVVAIGAALLGIIGGCSMQVNFLTGQPIASAPVPAPAQISAPAQPQFQPRSRNVATPPEAQVIIALRTEIFDSGELKMSDARSHDLEAFLVDLNQRKDYDADCHGGLPGPNAAFLTLWIQNVSTELQGRGYYYDRAGNLHRPGSIVAIR
jgi:hypothetical protein